jgi:hypothetical protein
MYDDEEPTYDLIEAMCIFALVHSWDVLSTRVLRDDVMKKEFRLFNSEAICDSDLHPIDGVSYEHILNPGYITSDKVRIGQGSIKKTESSNEQSS